MVTRSPRWYFSFRSPYSWLAYRDLTERHPDVADAIEWIPFWEPDAISERMLADAGGGSFPYVPMSKEKHLYILQDVRRLARARGLMVTWPVDREPCWEVAHLAYLVADSHGCGRDFVASVYQARWEQGRDISDPVTIAEISARVGLPDDEAAHAADSPRLRQDGISVLRSICHDGVFGVPFFIRGFDKFWGLDRLAAFVDAVREESPTRAGDEVIEAHALGAGSDWGHAGGCG